MTGGVERRMARTGPPWESAGCCFLLLLAPCPLLADTAALAPLRDNTLIESPTGGLSNGAGMYVFVGRTAQTSGAVRRGLVAFDVAAAIPERATITAVALTLHVSRTASAAVHDIQLHRLLAPWGEGTSVGASGEGAGASSTPGDATWIHRSFDTERWTNPGGDFEATPSAILPVSGPGDYTWGPTPQLIADVQSWLDAPAGAHGWILLGDESTPRSAKRFDSRQNDSPALRPALAISFTPATPVATSTWSRIKGLFH